MADSHPYSAPSTAEVFDPVYEDRLMRAEILLGAGRGQVGIVEMLMGQGLEESEAITQSYGLFRQAKTRLMKLQRLDILQGCISIGLGVVFMAFIAVFSWVMVLPAFVAVFVGVQRLRKVVWPKPLHSSMSLSSENE